MAYGVFIHTNHKQYVGALVSAYSMKRHSAHADELRIELIHTRDHPFLAAKEGQQFLRGGKMQTWRMEDLQSFTPLRFMPPELMGWEGRAVVVDPDIFAVGDIHELLTRDMQGKAIMCRKRPGKEDQPGGYATSVMLLENARLKHWRVEETFNALFEGEKDYIDWIELKNEDPSSIGVFEPEWNDFDHLTERTKLLHNTKRHTQPWKTGLPIDFVEADKFRLFPPKGWLRAARKRLLGDYTLAGSYKPPPDPNQERFFFGLLQEMLEQNVIDETLLKTEMDQDHIRHDALDVIRRTPPLPRPGEGGLSRAA
ncbi:MAG TPA: hypothetical protein VFG43_09620 [Geminicoccaceae bacterium]|nr:hypothetical protein [Geminicoccaceae bacterium]